MHSGTRIRLRLQRTESVAGVLLVPFSPESDTLLLCVSEQDACADSSTAAAAGASSVNRFPEQTARRHVVRLSEVDTMWVYDRPVHGYFSLGVYSGGLIGGSLRPRAKGQPNEGGLVTGFLIGALVGTVLERRANYWRVVYPCTRECMSERRSPGATDHPEDRQAVVRNRQAGRPATPLADGPAVAPRARTDSCRP